MVKRAVKKTIRADDKRATGTAKNPKTITSPVAKKTAVPPVPSYKKKVAGGGAGRPKKVR